MLKLRNRDIGLRLGLALICCILVTVVSCLSGALFISGASGTNSDTVNSIQIQGRVALIGILFGLTAGVITWWIGGYLIKPFTALTRAVHEIRNSHSYESAVRFTPIRETNGLISALNALFADMGQHRQEITVLNESLERRVRERTLELVLINDALQNEIEERRRLEEEREELMSSLLELASTDHLTQTFNRRTLFQIGAGEFERCRSLLLPLTVIMLDIDQFKLVNDTYGHATGDEVLRRVAQHLRTYVRDNDVIGRYGGEEFVFVLPDTDLEGALIVAERLRAGVLEASQLTSLGAQLRLSASLGVATLVPQIHDFSALVMQADHAHYAAKKNGKNQVGIAPQSLMAHPAHTPQPV